MPIEDWAMNQRNQPINVDMHDAELAVFCRSHHIRKLSLFGSALRDDFRPDSDVDLLVEFQPDCPVGLIKLTAIERALSALLGRTVDKTGKSASICACIRPATTTSAMKSWR